MKWTMTKTEKAALQESVVQEYINGAFIHKYKDGRQGTRMGTLYTDIMMGEHKVSTRALHD